MTEQNELTAEGELELKAEKQEANPSVTTPSVKESKSDAPVNTSETLINGGNEVQASLDMQRALTIIRQSPEIRAERIEALREQIEAGTYEIDNISLALKMLGIAEQQESQVSERE
jgi:flagellar biosynthesis anti-sigma factor FlgM